VVDFREFISVSCREIGVLSSQGGHEFVPGKEPMQVGVSINHVPERKSYRHTFEAYDEDIPLFPVIRVENNGRDLQIKKREMLLCEGYTYYIFKVGSHT
jgi:hypothetical protein